MRKILIVGMSVFVCLLWITFGTSTRATSADWQAQWDKMVEEGKKEGSVMIYGRGEPEVRKKLSEVFTGKYGIKLEFLYFARGGEMTSKLKKERSAGLYLPDIIIHGSSTMTSRIKSAGILDSMDPVLFLPEVIDPKNWRADYMFLDKAHTAKPMRATFMRYVTRNTDLVKEGEISSCQDLLDPKWKGKMVMTNPIGPGTGSGFVAFLNGTWGREKTVAYLKEFVKQEPILTKEARLSLEWVTRGKYALGIAMRNEPLPEFMKMGAPIALVKVVEGGELGSGAGNVGIVNKRPHPNAAAVFLNWLLTQEGQTAWSVADGYPSARLDVPTDHVNPVFLPDPGEKIWHEDEEALKQRQELWDMCKNVFAPLLQ